MTQNRFNVVDEAWIPVADNGLISLRDLFSRVGLQSLGGTALQKVALFKFLMAIVQAARTPKNTEEWTQLGVQGLSCAVLEYLERWHDSFWLYGSKPFLQMPAVKKACLQKYAAVLPEVSSGNTTVLTQWQHSRPLSDADKVLLVIVNMGCCFGGKKTDPHVVLSPGVVKSSSGKGGPSLCSIGLLHTFLTGSSIVESLWFNMLTLQDIADRPVFTNGLGVPPWEVMPQGEVCPVAEQLKASLMGRLVPMARFCLLEDEGLRFVEGLQYLDYRDGHVDPSASVQVGGKKVRMLWADPAKRPWRSLTAMLSFILEDNANTGFECAHLRVGLPRLAENGMTDFGIWSGGVKVSSNSGEQYLSGADDMVESEIRLDAHTVYSETWFPLLKMKTAAMDEISKYLYGAVMGYSKCFKDDSADVHAKTAQHLYWQLAEPCFQELLFACEDEEATDAVKKAMQRVVGAANTAFNAVCPQTTARQIQAWAQCRPRLGKFLE